MSGGNVAYNLRPSKAVERNLFIELLARIGRFANISDYSYFSLGGPFLEDFKLVHAALRMSKLTCIEENEEVIKRQLFNAPIRGLSFFEGNVNAFLSSFFPNNPCAVWLDYASPRQLDQQLTEFSILLQKLAPGDVFKITLNANPSTLATKNDGDAPEDIWQRQLEKLRNRAPRYVPAGLAPEDMKASVFPSTLVRALHKAYEISRAPKELVIQPLASFVYNDTHQMLTFTGIVLSASEVESFFEKTRLRHWPYANLDWSSAPKSISVPDLSLRERLRLESMMPSATSEDLMAELGYWIADSQHLTKDMLESFKNYYRLLPQYSRVVI
jgi:hypothetical protein